MSFLPKNQNGCPYLILAPMEGLGDVCFRKAMAFIGGFDEAVREFLRVPTNAHVKSLAARYSHDEISPFPLACQIMGSDPQLMADMAVEIERLGALRIDLNCGCPSNTVTGRGAGSSLLKNPDNLYKIAKSMVDAVSIPVTAKLRSGFDDISLFKENILAAQESGIAFMTLHPRTKADGYGPPARWDLIAEAKSLLTIPLVGNGDILNVKNALDMLKQTRCDGLMIGRGSVIDPYIFHRIKAHFAGTVFRPDWKSFSEFFNVYVSEISSDMPERSKISKLKQLLSFIFRSNEALCEVRMDLLRSGSLNVQELLAKSNHILKEKWLQSEK